MELPPEITVPISIEQGALYHFCIEVDGPKGKKYIGNRFFIVLNVNPKTDEVIVLTTITSRIEKAEMYIKKTGEDAGTLVRLSPADFPKLSVESIVNCNNIYPMTKEEIINKLEGDGAKVFFEKLPKQIIEALVGGVLKSTQVSNEHKKLLI